MSLKLKCLSKPASEEGAELLEKGKSEKKRSGGRGFKASFVLPFRREDVFAEVMHAEQPLGLTSPNVTLTIEKHSSSDKSVRVPLAAVRLHGSEAATPIAQVAIGCVRKASFSSPFQGFTVSELTNVEVAATGPLRPKRRLSHQCRCCLAAAAIHHMEAARIGHAGEPRRLRRRRRAGLDRAGYRGKWHTRGSRLRV